MINSLLMIADESAIWASQILMMTLMAYFLISRREIGLKNPTNQMFVYDHIGALGLATFVGGFVLWWATLKSGDAASAAAYLTHSSKWTTVGAIAVVIATTGTTKNTFAGLLGKRWWMGLSALYISIAVLTMAAIKYAPLLVARLVDSGNIGQTIMATMSVLWFADAAFIFWLWRAGRKGDSLD